MPTVISEEPGDAQTESIDRDEPASCAGNHAQRIGVHAENASANTLSDEEEPRLNLFSEYDDAPHLFLHDQPEGTTGLARRLDPSVSYVACRWDWEITPKDMLADPELLALVRAPKTGREFLAWPADWGPLEDTDRAADISKGLMDALGIETDDEIEVVYPAPRK